MDYAIGTFGGRVLVALREGRFPVDTGSPELRPVRGG